MNDLLLDTQVPRFDVAAVVRDALRHPNHAVVWSFKHDDLWDDWTSVPVVFDPLEDSLLVDDAILIQLERVPTRLRGRRLPGARLAPCPRRCGRLVRVLRVDPYDDELSFGCRDCLGIRYASAATSCEVERARLAHRRLRSRFDALRPQRRSKRYRELEQRVVHSASCLRSLRRERERALNPETE